MSKVNELMTAFATPIHITKYEADMTKEFDFVKNLGSDDPTIIDKEHEQRKAK